MRLGQAASSEFYSAWGEPGRQREGELNIVEWSLDSARPWHTVLRAKSAISAESIALAIEKAVANYAVGYSQNNGASPRTTLWDYASEVNWDISKITKACNTDCSALVGVACRCAGIKCDSFRDMYTGNMVSVLQASGVFDVFTDKEHCQTPSQLERGDILVRKGHTAVALDTAQIVRADDYAVVSGCAAVNMRSGPSTEWPVVSAIAGGSVLPYYSADPDTGWLQVDSCGKIGYISNKYGKVLPTAKSTGNVYIRETAGNGTIVGTIPIAQRCSVIESKKVGLTTWYRICYKGTIGWSSGKYIKPD